MGAVLKYRDPATGLYLPVTGVSPAGTIGRNRIINGDFSVNQRNFVSANTMGVTVIGLDRWGAASVGGTSAYSREVPNPGDLPESAKMFARINTSGQSSTNDYAMLFQKIEGVGTLSGKTVTVSFWAKAVSGTPKVAVELVQQFGTTGSPSAIGYVYAGQVTLSGSWTRYSVTASLPSISGKTVTTNDNLSVNLWTSGGSAYNSRNGSLGLQAAAIDFWGVQVEEGTVQTLFEQKTYAEELRSCMRYFQRYSSVSAGFWPTTTIFRVGLPLSMPLRVQPSLSLNSAGVVNWASSATGNNTFPTTVTLNGWYTLGLYIDLPGLTGGVQGAVGVWYSQLLDLNSELP